MLEAMMNSRREFLATGFGTALVAAVTAPIRAHEHRSAHGQSRAGAPKSARTTRKNSAALGSVRNARHPRYHK